jgi:glutathione S-transferase
MITLYGTSKSRASRSMVALEELGLSYTHVPLFQNGITPADRDVLRKLNPNARVPVLDDDGVVVWESMAINLYLADAYGGPLWPDDVRDRARVYQWSFWVQAEMDRRDWQTVWRSRDAEQLEVVHRERLATLRILDTALTGRSYLLGDAFTFADLNVAATLSEPHEGGRIDWQRLDPFEIGLPALGDWLKRCTSRESWRKVRELRG